MIGYYSTALRCGASDNFVLVLDASMEDAHRDETIRFVKALLPDLPANSIKATFFLGNARHYPFRDLLNLGVEWFKDNHSRVNLISPVFESIRDLTACRPIIIFSNSIFDIDDWAESTLIERSLFVEAKPQASPGTSLRLPIISMNQPDLWRALSDPVQKVMIYGNAFMPVNWGNHCFQVDATDANRIVMLANRATDYYLDLDYLAETEDPSLVVQISYSSGKTELLTTNGIPKDVGSTHEKQWSFLTAQEAAVFREASTKGTYACPYCNRGTHPATQLECSPDDTFPESIYKSLSGHRGFVLLREAKDQVQYHLSSSTRCLTLGTTEVVITDGTTPVLFNYTRGGWTRGAALGAYHKTLQNEHILHMR